MSCDGANKGMHHVVKIVAFWFTNRACAILLDSDAATGDNVNTALGIDCSLNELDELVEDGAEKVVMSGLSADAGSGGTREGLALQMSKLNRYCNVEKFLAATFMLHAMNLMMATPCEKFLGSGSIGQ